jgi:predicted transcriptional regulator
MYLQAIQEQTITSQSIVRVEPELKDRVSRLARAEGKTASEVVRELLTQYVQERAPGVQIDRLWARIRAQLPPEAEDPADVQEIIRQVRRGR